MNRFEKNIYRLAMADPEKMQRAIAKKLWNAKGGGGDFHKRKWNHAVAEGYELRYWEPHYPFEVME